MNQFCIITCDKKPDINIEDIQLKPFDISDGFIQGVAESLELEPERTWNIVDKTGDSAEELFQDASCRISKGENLSNTRLGKLVGCLIKAPCRIIAWDEMNYAYLDKVTDPVVFIDCLYRDLREWPGEVNLDFKSE